ncbi:hypothetical protein GCM10022409_38070 [Hymenobacter glaciei]|uniref:Glycosyl transferase family 1 n=1 Tax=Hymenobacter glaciei TaxID=877209 RepID=A0ABP7UNB7_9BACT
MKDGNIIMLCQQGWDLGIASNAKNLAKELAKDNRVLYVNLPLDVNTVLRGRKEPAVQTRLRVLLGQKESLVQAEPNLWVLTPRMLSISINRLQPGRAFDTLNGWNSRLLARSIRQATDALRFKDAMLLQDGIIFQGLDLPRLLQLSRSVYYLRDYTLGVPYFQRHGPRAETQLMQQADLVATNSAYLADYARQHTTRAHDIGQGCVLTMYDADADYSCPAGLAPVKQPRIVYTGFLTALRLDIELLLTIARQRPQWNLVLIGPEDEEFKGSELHQLPNVHFLGGKRPEELAAYLRHSNICINPQVVNDATVGNYPLKIDEYLAMGKPVVATHTRTMDLFADHVYLAKGQAQWLELLDEALMHAGPSTADARIAFARSHTWAASVQTLYQALDSLPTASSVPVVGSQTA